MTPLTAVWSTAEISCDAAVIVVCVAAAVVLLELLVLHHLLLLSMQLIRLQKLALCDS